ncbi:Crp/Fnr family transcriptional regulator [Tranquillimonas alkanivorans]|uniref:cAMP-binding domain of CRP or a regulatory subunit of cAMP-dependent protein kinases n=1 Tax=Tranquillimonas alkanivorans TaxID=441119 RepID=A0A1I5PE02_9RHOB|nr:Crp/Fnr family transcriptional regulator [Tranquillimonas alkanivorans]SFP32127.1 cAMP-binding domain of CRP or a regulatory subunit of cAMP-dependent protein kinases [Tranquillimonas alkanivorans]
MATKCKDCPLRALSCFQDFTQDELAFMQRFKTGELTVEAGTQLMMEGSSSPQLFTALRGMGVRYKTLVHGRRQVVNFILPGDFIGLQAGLMDEMRHSVEATTRMTLCVFNRSDLWTMFKHQPRRAYDLTWLAATEEGFLGEALATVGQRTAIERIAWALVRIFSRGEALGLVRDRMMPLPYRQQDLADALGLSLVHTNKTLAKLRERQLVGWQGGTLRINDLDALAALAGGADTTPEKRPLI